MKVTALGVNSAFATGEWVEAYTADQLNDIVDGVQFHNASPTDYGSYRDFLELNGIKPQIFYQPKFQSNFLLEFKQPGKVRNDVYRFVIDFGSDIRHALSGVGLKMNDIDGWYCSHPHADHIGGIEGISLMSIFNPSGIKKRESGRPETEISYQWPSCSATVKKFRPMPNRRSTAIVR